MLLPAIAGYGQRALWQHYTIREGLPSNRIYTIREDDYGRIWIATDKGLCRFDGKDFKTFSIAEGLPTNDVFGIFADSAQVWLYSYKNTFSYIRNDSVYNFRFPETTPFRYTHWMRVGKYCMISDRDFSRIVIASPESAQMFSGSLLLRRLGLPQYMPRNGLPYFNNREFLLTNYEHRKYFWYRFGSNMSRSGVLPDFDYHIPSVPLTEIIDSRILMRQDPQEVVMLHTNDGQPRLWRQHLPFLGPDEEVRYAYLVDRKLFYLTNKRIFVSDFQMHPPDFSLDLRLFTDQDPGLIIPFVDRSGTLWIGTSDKGVFMLSHLLREAVVTDPGKVILADYVKPYLLRFTHDRFYFRNTESADTTFHSVKAIAPASEHEKIMSFPMEPGQVVLHARGSLFFLRDGVARPPEKTAAWPYGFGLLGEMVLKDAIYRPSTGELITLDPGTVFAVRNPPFTGRCLLNRHYNRAVIDHDDMLWLGNDLGELAQYDFRTGQLKSRYFYYPILDLLCDRLGQIIVHVDGEGVFSYDKKHHHVTQLLAGNDIQLVKEDRSGLWIATDNAIHLLQLRQDGSYRMQRIIPNSNRILYDILLRLYELEGKICLFSNRGLIQLPGTITAPTDSVFYNSTHVAGITYRGHEQVPDIGIRQWKQPYASTDISFRFSCISTAYLGDISYQYMLDGKDAAWETSVSSSVTYPYLPPGDYTLHVRAVVNHTRIRSREYLLRITITPLWWQTLWFRAACVLLAVGLIVLATLLFIRRKNTVRLQEAELQRRMSELELSALQSQMNPHFIFNALTTVQSYVKQQDMDKADELLREFSRLVRMFLEFSRHPFTTLQQELDALQLYTGIEQQRFNNRFDIRLLVRLRDSPHALRLPPMLVQPLVENAIHHGLYHKEQGRGRLRMLFLQTSDTLTIVIDDNGIGRERAQQLRNRFFPSRGTSLIADRVEVLRKARLMDIDITVRDKYDRAGNAAGTRVLMILKIPPR